MVSNTVNKKGLFQRCRPLKRDLDTPQALGAKTRLGEGTYRVHLKQLRGIQLFDLPNSALSKYA
jgi:hypothetical protein